MADTELTLGAVGKVLTGFSKPWVAKYSANAGTLTFSDAQQLARGVSVSVEPDTPDDNKFHADNVTAEEGPVKFTSGTLTLTVDGLLIKAERMIMGLPAADADGWTMYGDDQKVPYIATGYIARYMSGGVESFVPTILLKCKYDLIQSSAESQEDDIDWQTQELTANITRADDENHNWKAVGKDFATEAEAEAALKKYLGVTTEAA